MSRQNKQVKKLALAAEFKALHLGGDRGPSRTTPLKRAGRHKDPDRAASRAEALAEMRTARYAAVKRRWGKGAVVTPW